MMSSFGTIAGVSGSMLQPVGCFSRPACVAHGLTSWYIDDKHRIVDCIKQHIAGPFASRRAAMAAWLVMASGEKP
jgi:hypothetical protein